MKLNPALKPFWKTRSQIKVLYGGRMSSKTEDTAGVLSFLSSKYKVRVACLRRFQNKIDESVYKVIKRKIESNEELKNSFNINKTTIESSAGSEFVFLGIQRNLEEIKGLDDIDITWIEEAEKLTKSQWDIIRPTILRKEGSFCILVFNPNLKTDYVYEEFVIKQQDNVLVRKINYNENPFLSNSAKSLIASDKKNMDEDEFENVYNGIPKSDDNLSIIKASWIEAAIDAHIVLGLEIDGSKQVGYDVADKGRDLCATAEREGILCNDIDEWKAHEDELFDSSEKVRNKAKRINADVIYDSVGVGAGTGSNIKKMNEDDEEDIEIKHYGFNAGGEVFDPEEEYENTGRTNKNFFENIKAQMWFALAIRFRNTYNAVNKDMKYDINELISIDSNVKNLERLKKELSLPHEIKSKQGKVMVETKDKLKARGFESPNIADAFVMTYYIPPIKTSFLDVDMSELIDIEQ
jgi:phage terminase large subunit